MFCFSSKDDATSTVPSISDSSNIIGESSKDEGDFVYLEVTCNKTLQTELPMLVFIRWPIGETDGDLLSKNLTLDELNKEGMIFLARLFFEE